LCQNNFSIDTPAIDRLMRGDMSIDSKVILARLLSGCITAKWAIPNRLVLPA
jgi:hypothetical protein